MRYNTALVAAFTFSSGLANAAPVQLTEHTSPSSGHNGKAPIVVTKAEHLVSPSGLAPSGTGQHPSHRPSNLETVDLSAEQWNKVHATLHKTIHTAADEAFQPLYDRIDQHRNHAQASGQATQKMSNVAVYDLTKPRGTNSLPHINGGLRGNQAHAASQGTAATRFFQLASAQSFADGGRYAAYKAVESSHVGSHPLQQGGIQGSDRLVPLGPPQVVQQGVHLVTSQSSRAGVGSDHQHPAGHNNPQERKKWRMLPNPPPVYTHRGSIVHLPTLQPSQTSGHTLENVSNKDYLKSMQQGAPDHQQQPAKPSHSGSLSEWYRSVQGLPPTTQHAGASSHQSRPSKPVYQGIQAQRSKLFGKRPREDTHAQMTSPRKSPAHESSGPLITNLIDSIGKGPMRTSSPTPEESRRAMQIAHAHANVDTQLKLASHAPHFQEAQEQERKPDPSTKLQL